MLGSMMSCLPNDQQQSIIITSSEQSPPLAPHLVITSSIVEVNQVPLSAAYAASKFAIQGYFVVVSDPICIDLLSPGPVDTEFHATITMTAKGKVNTDKNDKPVAPSKMKMHVDRCVALMLSCNEIEIDSATPVVTTTIVTTTITVSRSLIALQPSLAALYIQQWFLALQRRILGIVDQTVQLWRGIRFVRSTAEETIYQRQWCQWR
jgi:NAD(P)-dependent dehydrogenase (short-subunit alcohol dehydrogenase family)